MMAAAATSRPSSVRRRAFTPRRTRFGRGDRKMTGIGPRAYGTGLGRRGRRQAGWPGRRA